MFPPYSGKIMVIFIWNHDHIWVFLNLPSIKLILWTRTHVPLVLYKATKKLYFLHLLVIVIPGKYFMILMLHWTNIQFQLTKCGYTYDNFLLSAVLVNQWIYLSLKCIVLVIYNHIYDFSCITYVSQFKLLVHMCFHKGFILFNF